MANYLQGVDALEEVIDGFEALYTLVAGQRHLDALTGQTMACLMLPLLDKFRAAQQLLHGGESASPAPLSPSPDGGTPLMPDTADDLLRTLKAPRRRTRSANASARKRTGEKA